MPRRVRRRRAAALVIAALAVGWAGPAAAGDDATAWLQRAQGQEERAADGRPLVTELRGGLLAHNVGPIVSKREDGVDLNAEVLFRPIPGTRFLLSPAPTLGASVNTVGDTSMAYAGLTWTFRIVGPVVFGGFLGGAVHDGEIDDTPDNDGQRDLGCRVLFREALELGVRLTRRLRVAAVVDHVSHGGLCNDENEGLDNSGIRLHYLF